MMEGIDPKALPLVIWETAEDSGYVEPIRAVYGENERVLFEIREWDGLGAVRWVGYGLTPPPEFFRDAALLMVKEKSQKA